MKKLEDNFNLTPNKKPNKLDPTLLRRDKLIRNINKQLNNIILIKEGKKIGNLWWWINNNNQYYLSIKYGKKEIELGKNKYSILLTNLDEVYKSLEKIKELVFKGEFDLILSEVSKGIRKNFNHQTSS